MTNYDCATEMGYKAHVRRNDAPCRICLDWKKRHDAGQASKPAPIKAPKKPRVRTPRKDAQHGTPAGFHAHEYHGTEVCPPCREAINERNRERYAERKQTRPAPRAKRTDPIEHGTAKGRGQHKRRGEEPCTPCREAYNAANAAARAKRLAAAGKIFTPKVPKCGELSGYKLHRSKGEPTCDACRDANRKAKADYRERTGNR